jgi:hypothetical protein
MVPLVLCRQYVCSPEQPLYSPPGGDATILSHDANPGRIEFLERSTLSTAGDRCAAGFQSGLCRLWVIRVQEVAATSRCMSAVSQKRTNSSQPRQVRFVPGADICNAENCSLFDDLVGTGEQRRRHYEAERLGGLEIDGHLKFRELLHRQISRLLTAQNAAGVLASGAACTFRMRPTTAPSASSGTVKPCAIKIASVAPSRKEASNSSARRRVRGFGIGRLQGRPQDYHGGARQRVLVCLRAKNVFSINMRRCSGLPI